MGVGFIKYGAHTVCTRNYVHVYMKFHTDIELSIVEVTAVMNVSRKNLTLI